MNHTHIFAERKTSNKHHSFYGVLMQGGCVIAAATLFLAAPYAHSAQGIVPVNPETGKAVNSFVSSLSPAQFNEAANALTEFTTLNPDYSMSDVAGVLKEQGLNTDQMLELGAKSSLSPDQLGQLGKTLNLEGVSTTEITAGLEKISKEFPEMSIGAMSEMVDLGAVSGAQFGQFSEGMILAASSVSDIVGKAGEVQGQVTAEAQAAIDAVTGEIAEMKDAAAAEAMAAMDNLGANLTGQLKDALPAGVLSAVSGLLGGLNDMLGGFNDFLSGFKFPGLGGGFGGFGGGGSAGSASNYDNAQLSKQPTRATGVRGAGAGGTPMPMRGTAKIDMANVTPYLHKSLMGCGDNDSRKFYDGPASSFGRDNQYYNNKMVGYDNPDEVRQVSASTTTTANGPHTRLKGCVTLLEPADGVPNNNYNELSAEFLQRQAQHCANEYIILNSPYLAENNNPKVHGVDAAKDCQPLKMAPPQEEEFDLGEYYASCWKKLLNDPAHRMRSGEASAEPGYGDDVVILNNAHPSVELPSSFPNMKGAILARTPQEEITYPCHPFGMRWDFAGNDRDDYSPETDAYNGESSAVRCSGTLDEEIKVDIMNGERKELFDKRVNKRIDFNTQCMEDGSEMGVCCKPTATKCKPQPCWKCFGNPDPDSPPCATRYDGKDLSVISKYKPGAQYASKKNPQPWCGEVHAEKMCQDVAKSVLFLNKLKLRHYNDGEAVVTGDPNAAGEKEDKLFNAGMKFPDHFENRRPYMRFWDLGTAYEEDPIPTRQQLAKDKGAYVGIVGVGREKAPGKEFDERGMIGNASNDPISGGWAALKVYQANAMQKLGTSCLADFSATFKTKSPEEQALHQAGGTEVKVCEESSDAEDKCITKDMQWTPSHRGYQTDDIEKGQGVAVAEREREFGYFNDKGKPPGMITGLDEAQVGDILRLPKGASGNPDKPGLPTVATVLAVTEETVSVMIQNHGKNPDSVGNTDAMGVGVERVFYKPGADMDPMMFSELQQCDLPDGWTHSCPDINSDDCVLDCEDPGLKKCTFKNWDEAELYRVRDDYREGDEGPQ